MSAPVLKCSWKLQLQQYYHNGTIKFVVHQESSRIITIANSRHDNFYSSLSYFFFHFFFYVLKNFGFKFNFHRIQKFDAMSNENACLSIDSQTGVRLPEGASAALAKPTKYHYYPHNQHIYLLPECAVQQVCNAVYVRLNFTQPLCACPGRYRDPCSASLDSDDLHTTELVTDPRTKVSRLAALSSLLDLSLFLCFTVYLFSRVQNVSLFLVTPIEPRYA